MPGRISRGGACAGRGLALLLAAVLGLGTAAGAQAHANLVRAEPAIGSTVERAPEELVLTFSEPVDPGFTAVRLIDSQGRELRPGPGRPDPRDPQVWRLSLGNLPAGSYTAIWRNRSTVDGHLRDGSIPFGVGQAPSMLGLLPPLDAPDPLLAAPPPGDALLRALGFACAALVFGAPAFALLVWRPACGAGQDALRRRRQAERAARLAGRSAEAVPPLPAPLAASDGAMSSQLRRLLCLGAGLWLGVGVLALLDQARAAAAAAPELSTAAALAVLLGSRTGALWLARSLLLVAILVLAARLPAAAAGPARPWWVAFGLAGAALLTISLGSHAAARTSGALKAATIDWLHLVGMALWLGGLVPLAYAIRRSRRDSDWAPPLSRLVPRFSDLALLSIVLLAVTGLMAYRDQIGDLDLLRRTTYGRALAIKLALLGALVLLGALNRLVLTRHPDRPGVARAFQATVAAELALGAALLVAVGVMTAVAPSRAAYEAWARAGDWSSARVEPVGLTLSVVPGLVGPNAIALDVADPRPDPGRGPAEALLRLTRPEDPGPPLEIPLEPAPDAPGGRRYVAEGNLFTLAGPWRAEAILRRPGHDDVAHAFEPWIARRAEERVLRARPVVAGPVPSSPESIALGAALYAERCAACHGLEGRGDGPDASALDPPPADLRSHLPQHGDSEIYAFVALGIPGSAMPAFRESLATEELWHLVNYLRASFGE